MLVLIRGAGDIATGVAVRLHRCGFSILLTELPNPTAVRRTVAFSEAVYRGTASVEGITARLCETEAEVRDTLLRGEPAVIVDPCLLYTSLSPFFSDRRNSTVAEIREQLDYREANKEKVAAFNPTKSIGGRMNIYFDEDKRQWLRCVQETGISASAKATAGSTANPIRKAGSS